MRFVVAESLEFPGTFVVRDTVRKKAVKSNGRKLHFTKRGEAALVMDVMNKRAGSQV